MSIMLINFISKSKFISFRSNFFLGVQNHYSSQSLALSLRRIQPGVQCPRLLSIRYSIIPRSGISYYCRLDSSDE